MSEAFPITHISRLRMGTDGEGVRTLILVSGCPLRCKYCLNPFTWDGKKAPKNLTADEVYSQVRIDRPYILATNGGITFGGGEPLLYPQLICEVRKVCEPEMTIYAETALHVPWGNVEATIDVIDRYYVDIKTLNPHIYKEYTGESLSLAKTNLRELINKKGSDSVVVRVPIIPNITDVKEQEKTTEELRGMGVKRINLFKYKLKRSQYRI